MPRCLDTSEETCRRALPINIDDISLGYWQNPLYLHNVTISNSSSHWTLWILIGSYRVSILVLIFPIMTLPKLYGKQMSLEQYYRKILLVPFSLSLSIQLDCWLCLSGSYSSTLFVIIFKLGLSLFVPIFGGRFVPLHFLKKGTTTFGPVIFF